MDLFLIHRAITNLDLARKCKLRDGDMITNPTCPRTSNHCLFDIFEKQKDMIDYLFFNNFSDVLDVYPSTNLGPTKT